MSPAVMPPATVALERSRALFARAARMGADVRGVTRQAYGDSESRLLRLLQRYAGEIGLLTAVDPAGNLYMTLPGTDRGLPWVLTGSHADSVPQGGNFDGLAGILAGMAALETLRRQGFVPRRDLCVVAFRGEENAWFGAQHLGSRSALDLLQPSALQACRAGDGLSLAECMRSQGVDPDRLTEGAPYLHPGRVKCFLEVHIEQGPVLLEAGVPLGIVTGIRGNARCAQATCVGEAGHAGVVPRRLRHDAVVAAAELVTRMQGEWDRLLAEGRDLVMTFGRFHTDAQSHAVTTIAGRVDFSFEARSHDTATLDLVQHVMLARAEELAARHGVVFQFGDWTHGGPAAMDPRLRELTRAVMREQGAPGLDIASGAGHDAQDFVMAGIPAAMLFVRNANGSHNPDEAMDLEDYALAVAVLRELLQRESMS